MRIIIPVFILVILVLSLGLYNISRDTQLLNHRIRDSAEEIAMLKQEEGDLAKYKDEPSLALDKLYPAVCNDIRQICLYCGLHSDIRIIVSGDIASRQESFRPSEYKGIRYADILCQVRLKDLKDTRILDLLYKMIKVKPIEVTGLKIEKNTLNLTLRIYGP